METTVTATTVETASKTVAINSTGAPWRAVAGVSPSSRTSIDIVSSANQFLSAEVIAPGYRRRFGRTGAKALANGGDFVQSG